MADSEDKNKRALSEEFTDDLDAMLDEAASAIPNNTELMDDDDAIDQLLKENSLLPNISDDDQPDDLEELLSDDELNFSAQGQRYGREPEKSESYSFDNDEFAEIDEFADEMESSDVGEQIPDEDDFTVAEFDISYDDESENFGKARQKADSEEKPASKWDNSDPFTRNSVPNTEIIEQLSLLSDAQTALSRKVDSLASVTPDDFSEDVQRLEKSQQALKKQIEQRIGNSPVFAYAAVGIALVALVCAGVLGYSVWNIGGSVDELRQRLVIVEDNQEAIIVRNKGTDSEEINARLALQERTLAELSNRLSVVVGEKADVSSESISLVEIESQLSKALDEQKNLADTVDVLKTKIKSMENRANGSVQSKKSATVPQIERWSVNLVSFSQEWYANRKAEEYTKQGIPVLVSPVRIDGKPWYRLYVKGFDSKRAADIFAARVKKDLNLDSVWVRKE
ncbi:MAG: SPOR domain-containing protein [Gammaproteobacteria bacterium]